MKYKITYFFLFFFLFSCVENVKLIIKDKVDLRKAFTSKGFTLVYNNDLLKEKIIKKKWTIENLLFYTLFLNQKLL